MSDFDWDKESAPAFDWDKESTHAEPPKSGAPHITRSEGPKDMGVPMAVAGGALNVLPLGQKMSAGASSVYDYIHDKTGKKFSDIYENNLKFHDQANDATEDAHPYAHLAGNVLGVGAQLAAGAAAGGRAVAGKAVEAAPTLGSYVAGGIRAAAKAVPVNAAYGFTQGYGDARGTVAHNAEEGGQAALLATAIGVPVSMAGYMLSRGLQSAGRAVMDKVPGLKAKAVESVADTANAKLRADDQVKLKEFYEAKAKEAGLSEVPESIRALYGEGSPTAPAAVVKSSPSSSAFEESTATRRGRAAGKEGGLVKRAGDGLQAHAEGKIQLTPEELANGREIVAADETPLGRGMAKESDIRQSLANGREPVTNAMSTKDLRSAVGRGGDKLSGSGEAPAMVPKWTGADRSLPVPDGLELFDGSTGSADTTKALKPGAVARPLNQSGFIGAHGESNAPVGESFQADPRSMADKLSTLDANHAENQYALAKKYGDVPDASKADIALGALKGARNSAAHALPLAGPASLMSHKLALGMEAASSLKGAVSGGLNAMSPFQKVGAAEWTGGALKAASGGLGPTGNAGAESVYRMLLGKSAAAATNKDKDGNAAPNPDDPRRF